MKIEIVEFYPAKDEDPELLKGSLHIYIIDLEMYFRGITVIRKKGKWQFILPFKKGKDDEGKMYRYPVISFTSVRKNQELKKIIETQGKKYVEKFLKKKT